MSPKLIQILREAEYWRKTWQHAFPPAYGFRTGTRGTAVKYIRYHQGDRRQALRSRTSSMS